MRRLVARLACFAFIQAGSLGLAPLAFASLSTPFANLDQISQTLNIPAYSDIRTSGRTIKIAVLDNGFRNYAAEIGQSLPKRTVYHPGPVAVDPKSEESHGLFMAQLVSGLLSRTANGSLPYELHLFSAFGYSNLKAAIQKVVAQKFDIVLYAQVWEYGGNGDGRGFINALVSQAINAGIIWVNAAGNFGDATFRAPIERVTDDWAKLPGPNQSVQVRCEKPRGEKCKLRAVLTWNDFKDDVSAGTDKDLDFILTDDTLKIIRTSGLQQKKEFPEGQPGSSLYPREIIEAEIDPGLYYLRVKIRSQNFSSSKDSLRIMTSGDYIKQLDVTRDATLARESLLPPADHPGVLTIGASDSPKSSVSQSMKKPSLFFPSLVTLENGENYKGSSNSSAIAAAAIVLLKAIKPELKRDEVQKLLASGAMAGGAADRGQGLPLRVLQFGPTTQMCFVIARLPYLLEAAKPFLRDGAVSVATSAGIKIFTAADPFTLVPGLSRVSDDDMLVVTQQGYDVYPRSAQWQLRQDEYEVVQTPRGQVVCGLNGRPPRTAPASASSGSGQHLRLPDPSRL